jgi:hypothetical protein
MIELNNVMLRASDKVRDRVIAESGTMKSKCIDTAVAGEQVACGAWKIGKGIISCGAYDSKALRCRTRVTETSSKRHWVGSCR